MRNTYRLAAHCSLVALSLGWAASAMAQSAAAPAAEGDNVDAKEIVVTGSLIQRPNNTSVSPIVTVSESALKESGQATLQDALNQVPSFTVGGNATTGGQGTGGRATINLHGLGTNRNLVLLDGKRLPVSDIAGNVDINILPEAIIGGIDTITGGASAIYGSDAMSGVVNFKTIKSFDGIKVDLMDSISEKGDANKFNGSLAFGTHFGEDRGHLMAAFTYSKQDPVANSTRSFFHDKVPSSFIGTGVFVPSSANSPDLAVIQGIFAGYGTPLSLPGVVTGSQIGNLGFNNNGTLFTQNNVLVNGAVVQRGAVNYLGPVDGNGYMVVGNQVRMPVGQQGNLINAFQRKTAFVKADYDITPSLNVYTQFMYVDLTVNTNSGGSLTQFPTLTTIPVTNPFIPAALRTILASRPNPTANFNWSARYVGVPWKNWDENYQIQQYMAGLRGDIADGWKFDVFASYDESIHNQTMHDAVLKSQVQRLLSAADGGASLCSGGFNPFGDANARSLSDSCIAFMTKDARSQERLGQTQVQAQVNGKLFDLGAGPVQLAVVADYRRNTYSFSPDTDLTASSGFAPGANIEGVVNTLPVSTKSISVKEIAGQIDVPLIANKPMFYELAIGAAARVSDYSATGSVTSYEADARWRPVENLLFRGSYQRAVRAPNIGELFSPPQGNQLVIGTPPGSIGDPCDSRSSAHTAANSAQFRALCVAQGIPSTAYDGYQFPTTATGQVISGNLGLTPERATTFNLGFVFNAPRNEGVLGDFNLSLDYYNIKIKNVISAVPGLTVLSKCYNLDGSNPTYSATNSYCALITRDPSTGQLLNVATPFLNLGQLQTSGFEAQVHWGVPTAFLGNSAKLYVDTAVAYLSSYKVQLLPGAAFLDYTGVSVGGTNPGSVPPRATPRWKALTTFGFKNDTFGMGLRWHYQSAMKDNSAVLTPATASVGVGAYATWDLFANYKLTKGIDLRAGVTNLFNRSLPFVASSQNGTDQALYDAIGRSFFFGVKASF